MSRGISALVPKCPDSSAPVKIWCRIVSRHFGTILYWCRTVLVRCRNVLVPKCSVSLSDVIFCTAVQQLTRFQLTASRAVPLRQRSFLFLRLVIIYGLVFLMVELPVGIAYATAQRRRRHGTLGCHPCVKKFQPNRQRLP